MDSAYGIGVRNRFELYGDDDEVEDPFEILKQQEAELQKRKTEKPLKEKPKRGVFKPIANVGPKPKKDGTPTLSQAILGGGHPVRAQEKSVVTSDKFDQPGDIKDRNKRNIENVTLPEGRWKEEPRRGRGGFASGRGGLRGRGNDGFDQRGKREFDRQSGSHKSGVKPVGKRDGGGAHNWGTVKDDMKFEEVPDNEERNVDETATPSSQSLLTGPPEEKMKSEEELAMTLDEWKQKEQSSRSVPTYNLRKPGEGVADHKKWGKYMLKKKEFDEEEDDDDDELYDDDYNKRGRQKHHLDIEIKFGDMSLHERGRGRGLGRGGRGKNVATEETVQVSPAQTNVPQRPAPKVDDLNDFPSLCTT